MRSNIQKSGDSATPRLRALLTLAGVFAVGLLSSLGIATGSRLQAAPAAEGATQGRNVQALETRLLVVLDRQKTTELGGAGHSPVLAGAAQAPAIVESFLQISQGQTSPAIVPRWLLLSAPPRAPPADSAVRA